MLGLIPAAGAASRLQPLACSKELLPVGVWRDAAGVERPRAVAEYLLHRMVAAGADRLLLVISTAKTDLIRYFGAAWETVPLAYVIQPEPLGLCDALFRATPFLGRDEPVLFGLPDTLWFPDDAFAQAPQGGVHLITFPAAAPEHFDAVVWQEGAVARIEVKMPGAADRRVWGAGVIAGSAFRELDALWQQRQRRDQFLGHLLNAWIAAGGRVTADRVGTEYWDVGTVAGYRQTLGRLGQPERLAPPDAVQQAA
ncbi:MAG: sugar phosphate nucleotidyltransferase [Terriglobales bacterium]